MKRKVFLLTTLLVGLSTAFCAENGMSNNKKDQNGQMPMHEKMMKEMPMQDMNGKMMKEMPMQQANGNKQQEQKLTWTTNYEEAASQAQQGNKYLFLFFTGSDWCGWCKKFDNEVLSSPEFAESVGSRFVFVAIDFPMNKTLPEDLQKQNADLKKKYGVTGYPTVVILDSSQNFIAETGYRPGGGKAYADYLLQLIQ